MTPEGPYNPLEKINLAQSIATALLQSPALPLGELESFQGAGVYALYYKGSFPAYAPLAQQNAAELVTPIYVGKASPAGGRKGGLSSEGATGKTLYSRLSKHSVSISSCNNLDVADFMVRFLVVDDIWIPLGENMLIEEYQPLWNRVIDGFGNNDPGRRRATQYKSPWDVLHPGRPWADKLAENPVTAAEFEKRIADFFAGVAVQTVDSHDDDTDDGEE